MSVLHEPNQQTITQCIQHADKAYKVQHSEIELCIVSFICDNPQSRQINLLIIYIMYLGFYFNTTIGIVSCTFHIEYLFILFLRFLQFI